MDLGKAEAVKRFPALHCWSQASRFHRRPTSEALVPSPWELMRGRGSDCLQHTQLRVRCWMPLNPLKLCEGNIWSSNAPHPVTTWVVAGAGSDCQSGVPFLSFCHGPDGLLLWQLFLKTFRLQFQKPFCHVCWRQLLHNLHTCGFFLCHSKIQ